MGKEGNESLSALFGYGVIATVAGFVLLIFTIGHSPNKLNWALGWSFNPFIYYPLLGLSGLMIIDGIIDIARGVLRERNNSSQT